MRASSPIGSGGPAGLAVDCAARSTSAYNEVTAASSINAMTGLIVTRHANGASSAVSNAAIITPKPTTKTLPRSEAVSGSASSARHSGQLGSAAIQVLASTASVSGFQPCPEASG